MILFETLNVAISETKEWLPDFCNGMNLYPHFFVSFFVFSLIHYELDFGH